MTAAKIPIKAFPAILLNANMETSLLAKFVRMVIGTPEAGMIPGSPVSVKNPVLLGSVTDYKLVIIK